MKQVVPNYALIDDGNVSLYGVPHVFMTNDGMVTEDLDRTLIPSSSVTMPSPVVNTCGTPLWCTTVSESAFDQYKVTNTKPNSGRTPDVVCARVLKLLPVLRQGMRGCTRSHGPAERNICAYLR